VVSGEWFIVSGMLKMHEQVGTEQTKKNEVNHRPYDSLFSLLPSVGLLSLIIQSNALNGKEKEF
jgi:hypothetical protein